MEKKKGNVKLPTHGQTACIFCGGTPLTEEHIFTDVIKKIIPRIHDQKTTQFFSEASALGRIVHTGTKVHNGHAGNQRLKIVCGPCNNGWMNRIEQEAIILMKPLMLGHPAVLKTKEQAIIAKWAVMKTMLAEYTDIERKAVPAYDRKEFMETNVPPKGWQVWIAKYQAIVGELRHHHTGSKVVHPAFRIGFDKEPDEYNTQYSIFCIQNLIIYTFRSTYENKLCKFSGYLGERMIQIFPKIYWEIDWEKVNTLKQEDYWTLRRSHV